MKMRARLRGGRNLERALNELGKGVTREMLERVGREALQPMAEHARRLAPRLTGDLALSIEVSPHRTRRVRGKRRAAFAHDFKRHMVVAMGPAGGFGALYYAYFVEFGTSNMPAQPFLRPAWEANKAAASTYLVRSLRAEIALAARKAAA